MDTREDTYLSLLALHTEISTIKTNAILNIEEYEVNPLGFILSGSKDPLFCEILVRFSHAYLQQFKGTAKQWEVSCLELPLKILECVDIDNGKMILNEKSQDFLGFFIENWS